MSSNMDKPNGLPIHSPGYETSDANVRSIVKLMGTLALVLVFTGVVCLLMFRHFAVSEVDSSNPSPFVDTRQVPSGPQLQVNPRQDLLNYQDRQQQSLESYSWEDRAAGKVRIPVVRAMEVLLDKGLPVAGPSAAGSPSTPKSESATVKTSPKVEVKN